MSRYLSTRNISSKFMHAFLSNLANSQTDRHTYKRTRAKNLPPPLSEIIKSIVTTLEINVPNLHTQHYQSSATADQILLLLDFIRYAVRCECNFTGKRLQLLSGNFQNMWTVALRSC